MIKWKPVLRTLIQASCGSLISVLTLINIDCDMRTVIATLITAGTTTAVAVLMNIQKQTEDEHDD